MELFLSLSDEEVKALEKTLEKTCGGPPYAEWEMRDEEQEEKKNNRVIGFGEIR